MLNSTKAFSGFSVDNIETAKEFYSKTLGLSVEQVPEGLQIQLGSGAMIFVYPKQDHVPATFTILNFPVENIDETVDELISKGVKFEHYDSEWMKTDEKGIVRGKPVIAWFKDPAGNFFSIIQE